MTFIQSSIPGVDLYALNIGPIKYLLDGMVRFLSGLKNALKSKKQFISVIILTLMWLVLSVLPILGISPSFFKYLNFLTLAQGGLGNGVTGIIGGTIGKGVFAYFLFALIIPKQGPKLFAGVGAGIKNLFGSLSIKNMKMLALMLIGISASLLTYKFLTGDATLQNSMAGIAAFFVSVRALANKAGFLRGFVTSIVKKYFKNIATDITNVNRIIAGWTAGFALAVVLSAAGIGSLCLLAGILLLIVAIVLAMVSGKRKGAAVR
jgi:hypothetical protein